MDRQTQSHDVPVELVGDAVMGDRAGEAGEAGMALVVPGTGGGIVGLPGPPGELRQLLVEEPGVVAAQ